jgi:phytoene synthase
LQQTNILRDLREDLVAGRVYLPRQELDAYGIQLTLDGQGALSDVDGRLTAFIQAYAARTRHWYAFGLRLMPLLDRRSAACASAMAGIYRRLLDRIAADPSSVYGQRLSLTGWQKAGVAARAVIGVSS